MRTEYTTVSGEELMGCTPLATGGSSDVCTVTSRPDVVFKRYLREVVMDDPTLPERLAVMVAQAPMQLRDFETGHLILAWPSDIVLCDGLFAGYLMPVADLGNTQGLDRVTDATATGTPDQLPWRESVRAAAHLAFAIDTLHQSDIVAGDLAGRHVRVDRTGQVTLLDCDSMQVTDHSTGITFPCREQRPEHSAPELAGGLGTARRQPASDLYPLAVHLFRLLVPGGHPPQGAWNGSGSAYPIGMDLLPPSITALFRRAFEDGAANPDNRPSALTWHTALHKLSANLAFCATDPDRHQYWVGHRSCPWCALPGAPTAALPTQAAPARASKPARVRRRRRVRRWAWASTAAVALGVGAATVWTGVGAGGPTRSGTDGPAQASVTTPVTPVGSEAGVWPLDGTGAERSGRQPVTASGGLTWTIGRSGGAARFDGTGAASTGGPVLVTERSFSVSAWVRLADIRSFRTAVSLTSYQKPVIALQYRPPQNAFCATAVPADSSTVVRIHVCATAPAVVGEWTHLAAVFDGDAQRVTLHVNGGSTLGGESVQAPFTTPWRATGPLVIGRGQHLGGPADFWIGDLDDVRAYQHAITVEELTSLLTP